MCAGSYDMADVQTRASATVAVLLETDDPPPGELADEIGQLHPNYGLKEIRRFFRRKDDHLSHREFSERHRLSDGTPVGISVCISIKPNRKDIQPVDAASYRASLRQTPKTISREWWVSVFTYDKNNKSAHASAYVGSAKEARQMVNAIRAGKNKLVNLPYRQRERVLASFVKAGREKPYRSVLPADILPTPPLRETEEPEPHELIQHTPPRFYVQIDAEDKKRAERHGVWSYKHKVRDRVKQDANGRNLIVRDNLGYLDAVKLAQQLNDRPHFADIIHQELDPDEAPRHYFGTV